MYERLLAN